MTNAPEPPILLVAGPTASGKSALALRLAEEFGGTIINADSMQLYRDLAVLTARPGSAEEERAPHRLYGIIDAAESCSVGRWRRLALDEIAEARAAGRVPTLVGGSGLYLHALLRGLADIPPVPAVERERARALHAQHGAAGFHALLAERDPEGAARLIPGDTQRLIRAYEVVAATGRPLGAWQREPGSPLGMTVAAIVLLPPRPALYTAIDARFLTMLEAGAVPEVQALLGRGLSADLPVMKAVGVREIGAWLAGETSRGGAITMAQQATRRYAKRQFTWLRHRLPAGQGVEKLALNAQFSERILPEIFAFIRHFLLTHPT